MLQVHVISHESLKLNNVAYMKREDIREFMKFERNPIRDFIGMMPPRKSCHVIVEGKLVVEVQYPILQLTNYFFKSFFCILMLLTRSLCVLLLPLKS